MADFLEERIAAPISYASSWSDEFAVEITRTASGAEYRRLLHPYPVRRFRLHLKVDREQMFVKILGLYFRVFGRYAGFRAKAIDDFSTAANGRDAPSMLDQVLVRLSSGVYQLRKVYGSDASGLSIGRPQRTIFKPVTGSLVLAVNGVLKSSGVTVDTTTGQVTVSAAPLITDVVTAGCFFDIPVRFDTALELNQDAPNFRALDGVELIELLNP